MLKFDMAGYIAGKGVKPYAIQPYEKGGYYYFYNYTDAIR